MNLPKMYRIRQRFDDTGVKDIRETVRAELGGLSWSAIQPGWRSQAEVAGLPISLESWGSRRIFKSA